MTATAIATHRVTMPKKVSLLLSRKAKSENITFSKALLAFVEAQIEYLEEGHIWEEALENAKTCKGNLVPLDEVMRRYNAL